MLGDLCVCVCVLSHFSHIQLFATPWTVACHIPLSMGLPRQEYWGGLPYPPPGDLPDPGIAPSSPVSPALQVDSILLSQQRSPSDGKNKKPLRWKNIYLFLFLKSSGPLSTHRGPWTPSSLRAPDSLSTYLRINSYTRWKLLFLWKE